MRRRVVAWVSAHLGDRLGAEENGGGPETVVQGGDHHHRHRHNLGAGLSRRSRDPGSTLLGGAW